MTIPTTTPGRDGHGRTRIAVLAVAVLGLTAPAASAGRNVRIDGKYGYVKFDSEGEKLSAADIYEDGFGVRA